LHKFELMSNKVILFNPKSAEHKHKFPNSILSIGASIDGKYDYVFVDGNREKNPEERILNYLKTGEFKYFGSTVMPGPQLKQAIPITKKIKELYPEVINIWGGYFASNQHSAVLESGYIDFVIYGPGDFAFPDLLNALQHNTSIENIENLIYIKDGKIIRTHKANLYDQDALPPLPYEKLNNTYNLNGYLGKTYLGKRTLAYHSSVGCPFTCSFCAVVPIYEAKWKAKSALAVYNDIKFLKDTYGADAIEFHDNNFFVSEKRTVEFASLIKKENMVWWGEGRIDTINKYKDESLAIMRDAGCKMIFFGAETGNDAILKKMDKGGTQTAGQIRSFAARMAKFDIIPEYSFVLGSPAENPQKAMEQIEEDIAFIKEIKEINPNTEIIIYIYSPVPTEGSELYKAALNAGFSFPKTLEEWISPRWESFDLRKNPLTPWLTPAMIDKIKNFETVLNGYYPTVSDIKLSSFQRKLIRLISTFRYKTGFFHYPYELKALQKFWLKYRQPEIEGF